MRFNLIESEAFEEAKYLLRTLEQGYTFVVSRSAVIFDWLLRDMILGLIRMMQASLWRNFRHAQITARSLPEGWEGSFARDARLPGPFLLAEVYDTIPRDVYLVLIRRLITLVALDAALLSSSALRSRFL